MLIIDAVYDESINQVELKKDGFLIYYYVRMQYVC